jgi:hypothetical protein
MIDKIVTFADPITTAIIVFVVVLWGGLALRWLWPNWALRRVVLATSHLSHRGLSRNGAALFMYRKTEAGIIPSCLDMDRDTIGNSLRDFISDYPCKQKRCRLSP